MDDLALPIDLPLEVELIALGDEAIVEVYIRVLRLKRLLELHLDARLDAGVPLTAEGYGTVTKTISKDRKAWKKDEVLAAARRAYLDSREPVAVDPDSGEITVHSWAQAEEFFTSLWNLAEPRKTPLRALGLDPDEFCETGAARVSFQVVDNQPSKLPPTKDGDPDA